MKPEHILQASLLDIIFETRNKSYGAYALRNDYGIRMQKALLFPCLFAIAIYFITLTIPKDKIKDEIVIGGVIVIPPTVVNPPDKPITPPPPKSGGARAATGPIVFTNDSIVRRIDSITSAVSTGPDTSTIAVTPFNSGGADGPFIGDTTVTIPAAEPVIDHVTPTLSAEIAPEFPGGNKALLKFLERNIQQPADDNISEGEMISVKARFVIGYDGELRNYEILQSGGEPYSKEVLRVLKKMPKWIPGKTKGKNVSVWYTIPVKFMSQ